MREMQRRANKYARHVAGVHMNKTDQRRHKSRLKDCIVESNLLILISLLSLTNKNCRIYRLGSPPFPLHPILRLSKENGAADRLHTTDSTYTHVHKTRGWKEPNKKIIQSSSQNPKQKKRPPSQRDSKVNRENHPPSKLRKQNNIFKTLWGHFPR